MSEQRDAVLREWLAAKDAAAKWQARERELRDFICAQYGYLPDQPAQSKLSDGTHYFELGSAYKLKLVTATNLTVKQGPEFDQFLTAMRSASGGVSKLDALIKFKPNVSKPAYAQTRVSDPGTYALLSPAIVAKPAAPTLELIAI